jgi:hypothetical protein
LGWLTTTAYLVTASLSYFVLQSAPPSDRAQYRYFWILMAGGFALLGFNKQLDLQTLFTAAMKCAAQAGGWYAERRLDQELFVVGLVLGCGLLFLSALLCLRGTIYLIAPALLGSALIIAFVVLRAASFYHEDELIGVPLPSTGLADALLELPGIGLVALNATQLILSSRGKH